MINRGKQRKHEKDNEKVKSSDSLPSEWKQILHRDNHLKNTLQITTVDHVKHDKVKGNKDDKMRWLLPQQSRLQGGTDPDRVIKGKGSITTTFPQKQQKEKSRTISLMNLSHQLISQTFFGAEDHEKLAYEQMKAIEEWFHRGAPTLSDEDIYRIGTNHGILLYSSDEKEYHFGVYGVEDQWMYEDWSKDRPRSRNIKTGVENVMKTVWIPPARSTDETSNTIQWLSNKQSKEQGTPFRLEWFSGLQAVHYFLFGASLHRLFRRQVNQYFSLYPEMNQFKRDCLHEVLKIFAQPQSDTKPIQQQLFQDEDSLQPLLYRQRMQCWIVTCLAATFLQKGGEYEKNETFDAVAQLESARTLIGLVSSVLSVITAPVCDESCPQTVTQLVMALESTQSLSFYSILVKDYVLCSCQNETQKNHQKQNEWELFVALESVRFLLYFSSGWDERVLKIPMENLKNSLFSLQQKILTMTRGMKRVIDANDIRVFVMGNISLLISENGQVHDSVIRWFPVHCDGQLHRLFCPPPPSLPLLFSSITRDENVKNVNSRIKMNSHMLPQMQSVVIMEEGKKPLTFANSQNFVLLEQSQGNAQGHVQGQGQPHPSFVSTMISTPTSKTLMDTTNAPLPRNPLLEPLPLQSPSTPIQSPSTPLQSPSTPLQSPSTPLQSPSTPTQPPTPLPLLPLPNPSIVPQVEWLFTQDGSMNVTSKKHSIPKIMYVFFDPSHEWKHDMDGQNMQTAPWSEWVTILNEYCQDKVKNLSKCQAVCSMDLLTFAWKQNRITSVINQKTAKEWVDASLIIVMNKSKPASVVAPSVLPPLVYPLDQLSIYEKYVSNLDNPIHILYQPFSNIYTVPQVSNLTVEEIEMFLNILWHMAAAPLLFGRYSPYLRCQGALHLAINHDGMNDQIPHRSMLRADASHIEMMKEICGQWYGYRNRVLNNQQGLRENQKTPLDNTTATTNIVVPHSLHSAPSVGNK